MAILRKKEIESMPKEELESKLKELKTELIRTNTQRATSQSTGKLKEIKKTVARILTALRKKYNK